MNFGMDISQSQRLEQTISPQMLQAVAILQKNALELETAIKNEVEANPLLEFDEPSYEDEADEPKKENDDENQEIDFESGHINDGSNLDYEKLDSGTDSENDWDSSFSTPLKEEEEVWDNPLKDREQSLQDNLKNQLRDWNGNPLILDEIKKAGCSEIAFRELVEYLIDSLDENGFLQVADDMAMFKILADNNPFIVEIEKYTRNELDFENLSVPVAEALHVLQNFKPRGIGARNVRESFIIQAEFLDDFPALGIEILKNNYDDLMAFRHKKIAKDLGVSVDDVKMAVENFSRLAPHPGLQISSSESNIKVADLKVEEKRGKFEVSCFRKSLRKRLHLNKTYTSLLANKSLSKADREFIQTNMYRANEFIRAVDNRFSTMENVMRVIVERQIDFFKKGPEFLKPMILQEIADIIGRDASTVSRVTSGKYVDTPYGIFELKQFFTSGIRQGSDENSEVIGSSQVLNAIKKLIEEEDKQKPLSDQAIANALEKQGLKVARRTVAKYREEELKILSARLRKK